MKDLKEECKCLASLAVFRELYNSEKDVYGIIAEFLKEVLISNSKHVFSLTEITILLNETYDFVIPEAVVSTALNRLKKQIKKENSFYSIVDNSLFSRNSALSSNHAKIQNSNAIIIENLFVFIEQEINKKLSSEEKALVLHSFCSFILDETTQFEYSEYISAFVIKGKGNDDFISQLNTIKEGVVLYTGLRYNSKLNELGSWNTELTIYIETEILFHLAGYNGELYRILFNDFYSLIEEINRKNSGKSGKRLINLKYFTEVKDEIDRFFKKAEIIVSGKDTANPAKTAMNSIINGCQTPAEIVEKKAIFFELLKSKGIQEDDYNNYYSENNYRYNIEDKEAINEISQKTGIEDVTTYLRYLNFINIHRRGISDRGFENAGYILLSGTKNTLLVAWDDSIKHNGDIPLASDLNFLTNKFWFNLNKGFGKEEYPKSFDIVTKAQIILSTQLNDSVASKFEDLQKKSRNGELTEQTAAMSIFELRRQAKKPENINEDDVVDVLKSISDESIESYLKEHELARSQTQKQVQENEELRMSISRIKEEQKAKELKFEETLSKKDIQFNQLKEELDKLKSIEKERSRKNLKIKRLLRSLLFSLLVLLALLYMYCNDIIGITMTIVSALVSLLVFFGIDYQKIRAKFKKDRPSIN